MELENKTGQNGYGLFFVDFTPCFTVKLAAGSHVCAGSQVSSGPTAVLRFHTRLIEMYLFFFISMKEQVINSVGKWNPACYPPSVIQIPLGSASCPGGGGGGGGHSGTEG